MHVSGGLVERNAIRHALLLNAVTALGLACYLSIASHGLG